MSGLLETSWEMHASSREDGELAFFGPLGFALQDTLAKQIVRVWLLFTEEPEEQDYWAWLDYGMFEPCHIGATEAVMTRGFLAGQPDAPGPREEEKVGQGRILRLKVSVLEEVYLRTGRRRWRPNISSAM